MLIKELEALIKSVIIDNRFKYKKEIQGFSWTKKSQGRQEEIVLGYRTFHPNVFQIYRPSVFLYFDEVETILEECLEKNNVKNIWGLPHTIHSTLYNIEGIDYSKFETKIHDEASFRIVAEEIKKIIEYGAMPFFEKYQTLEEVANLLSDKKGRRGRTIYSRSNFISKDHFNLEIGQTLQVQGKIGGIQRSLKATSSKERCI